MTQQIVNLSGKKHYDDKFVLHSTKKFIIPFIFHFKSNCDNQNEINLINIYYHDDDDDDDAEK
jgi:hypothetical protein